MLHNEPAFIRRRNRRRCDGTPRRPGRHHAASRPRIGSLQSCCRRSAMSHRSPDEQAGQGRIAVHRNALTEDELIWIEGRNEPWTRFGRIAAERIGSRTSRMDYFREHASFMLWSVTLTDNATTPSVFEPT